MKTKSALIADIGRLVGEVGDKFDGDDDGDAERDFMVALCPPRFEQVIRTLPTLSIHLLAQLADAPTSVVGLAQRSRQLKGTVSKHVQRLVEADLVQRNPIPGNRKEVELRLTDDGICLIEAHRRLHDEIDRGLGDVLGRYTQAELDLLARVLGDLARARKVGVRLEPGE